MKALICKILTWCALVFVLVFLIGKDDVTIWAALIGAFALYIVFLKTAKLTFQYHKSDKLADAKLKIYLEFCENFSDYIFYLSSFSSNIDDNNIEIIKRKALCVFSVYTKVGLLSQSETKLKLNDFIYMISDLNIRIIKNKKINIEEVFNIEEEAIKISWLLRKELGVKTHDNIEHELLTKVKQRNSEVASSLIFKRLN